MKVKSVGRLSKPFEGTDAIAEWHKERTKSSVSEAFRDADYAIAIETPRSELKDCLDFIGGMIFLSPFIFVALYVFYLVLKGTGAL